MELLKRVPLFADCTTVELAVIAGKAQEVYAPSGSVIVEQGSEGDRFFVVAEGLAHVHVDGRKIASIGAGSFFGEMALIDHAPRSATVTAELPVRLLVIDEAGFETVRTIPSVAEKVLVGMAERLRAANVSA
ncbi:MAG: cyclic nucleotide-binding domain-containing protein [Acidimicrobiales bacterium]